MHRGYADPLYEPSDAVARDIAGLVVERRESLRDRSDWVTPLARERLVRYQDRALSCGDGWLDTRRVIGDREYRILVPLRCGWRGCQHCGRSALARLGERLADAPWERMITLTVPPEVGVTHSWLSTSEWIDRWIRWMRADSEEFQDDWDPSRERDTAHRRSRLGWDYAWVIEQQPGTSMPHWHMLCTVRPQWDKDRFVALAARMRGAWQGIIGSLREPIVHVRNLKSPRHAASYVSTYCSKSLPEPHLLALLGRRRIFGTSLRAKKNPPAGWTVDHLVPYDEGSLQIEIPSVWDPDGGWRYEYCDEIGFSAWHRNHTDACDAAGDMVGNALEQHGGYD